jgi:hypothetical protein
VRTYINFRFDLKVSEKHIFWDFLTPSGDKRFWFNQMRNK